MITKFLRLPPHLIAWFAVTLLMSTNLKAQQPVALTLKDALAYALKANQNARKAALDVENANYQVDEVRARALPQINGTGALTYNPILQLSSLPGELLGQPGTTILAAFGQKWGSNIGASLTQNLFDQSIFTGLVAAKTTREYYQLNAKLTEEQIIEQVANSYYQVLLQRQKMVVVDSSIKNTTEVQRIIKGQFDNGLAKKIDVDRIEVNISNLNSQRQQLLNAVSLAENQLKFLMGMAIQTQVIIPPIEFNSIVMGELEATDSLQADGRTELQVLKKQEQLLSLQKKAYKGEYYPTLSLSGNYSYQGIGNDFPIFKGASSGVNWFDVASVGINLKIPIFNGGATKSRIRQADVAVRKLQEDLTNTNLSLNKDFENAKTQIKNSIIILNNQQKNVQLARQVYDNTQNNYNNGLAPLTDLLEAENALTEAQNNHSSALLDYRIAEILLMKSKGNLKQLLN